MRKIAIDACPRCKTGILLHQVRVCARCGKGGCKCCIQNGAPHGKPVCPPCRMN